MKKLIRSIPEVFSITGNDYSKFLVRGGAEQMMTDAWKGIGMRMSRAIVKVGQDVEQKHQTATRESGRKGPGSTVRHREAA